MVDRFFAESSLFFRVSSMFKPLLSLNSVSSVLGVWPAILRVAINEAAR